MAGTNILPHRSYLVERFGKGDEQRMQDYLMMLGSFLAGHSENTARVYKTAIKQFFSLFDWISPEDVTVGHAVAFKKWLLERRKVSEATTYYRLCALKSFFDFLRRPLGASAVPLIQNNPFDAVPRGDIQPSPYERSESMNWQTFEKIMESIPNDSVGLRDKAILLFFAYTGRRRSEVASLRVKDLNTSQEPYSYRVRVKGNRIQQFELPDICWEAIRAYWVMSDRLHKMTPESGVFTADVRVGRSKDYGDAPLSNRMMNNILSRAAKRAGVQNEPGIKIHALRHMAARDLDRAGVRLQDIQAFLGHSSPTTTQVYLDRLSGPAPAHEDVLTKVRQQAKAVAAKAASD